MYLISRQGAKPTTSVEPAIFKNEGRDRKANDLYKQVRLNIAISR